MPRGVFITFEGGEACGKTTQIRLLQDRLRAMGRTVLAVREPGGTPLGEKIRHLLKHDLDGNGMSPETELLLMNASRAELVRKVICPALDSGSVVLCDRFSDSTLAYQGGGRGLDPAMVRAVVRAATGTLWPDLTLWLRLSPDEAIRRLRERKGEQGNLGDRFDDERSDFFERVERAYEQLAREEPHRMIPVPAEGSPETVAGRIWRHVEVLCSGRTG
ncbi:MAG: dTMP kinase [Verrucomicrobiota bacterium]